MYVPGSKHLRGSSGHLYPSTQTLPTPPTTSSLTLPPPLLSPSHLLSLTPSHHLPTPPTPSQPLLHPPNPSYTLPSPLPLRSFVEVMLRNGPSVCLVGDDGLEVKRVLVGGRLQVAMSKMG
ncbi:hypothetical protein Pmani_035990 [Petrolisthes manimaculis]|uniref:Uncharacterized protein n=1 Tax=Petrolisthes manimaculis TaxID=1843537 RepID=A0AAE1NL98_9EUCA|nr:hypothetical protein Pmani_035990 [Petrolisthes manimaculis]